MSLTTQEIIDIGRVCEVYAANELRGGKLNGGLLDVRLPHLINAVTTGLEWLYLLDPTSDDIIPIGNYLISICKHQAKAEYEMSVGGGGVLPNVINPTIFPFYITEADFESDGLSYNNPSIVGAVLELFIDEYSQQFYTAGTNKFSMTSTGFIISLPGFSAASNTYTIRVGRVGSA